ncbi:MAG: hypothetical protein JJE51_05425 [Thermoanaerobaculia bacterium]|nr:hypothetical protein [Thermoanaerobaculia bacterium]
MRSLALAVLVAVFAVPLSAFDTNAQRGDRIGVITNREVNEVVCGYLTTELRRLGFEAFRTSETIDDLAERNESEADYYVELVAGGTDNYSWGGVDIGGDGAGVGIDVGTTFASARIQLYDGRTLELIDTFEVRKKTTAVGPSAIGIGGRHVGLWIAVPFVRYMRERSAIRAVAREAAQQIAEAQAR